MKTCPAVVVGIFATLLSAVPGRAELEVRVFNHTGVAASNIFLLPSDTLSGTNFNTTYGTNTAMQVFQSVPLSSLASTSNYHTFRIGYSSSLAMFVGLNSGNWINTNNSTATPSYTGGPVVPWSQTPFGAFELSYTNGVQDNADTTAINSLGVPMMIRMANSSGPIAGATTGFTNASKIPALNSQLAAIPGSAWLGAAPNTNVIRYIGPTQVIAGGVLPPSGGATGTNAANPQTPFPVFTDYLANVQTRTNATSIGGQVSIKVNTSTNWQFNYDFDMYVTNGAVVLTNGTITATNTDGLGGASYSQTNLGAVIVADGGSATNAFLSYFIYAAPASYGGATNTSDPLYAQSPVGLNQIVFSGDWETIATDTGLDYFTTFAPKISDYILGDVAFGFAGGFVNSVATNGAGTPIGDLTSSDWWTQDLIFGGLQTNASFYSQYAAAIFDASTSVYAHPYGDRMKNVYPPSISLNQAPGSWLEVHLYDPAAIPEPVAALLVTCSIIGFALFKAGKKRRDPALVKSPLGQQNPDA